MKGKKEFALSGIVLIIVGIIGIVFTYDHKQEKVAEEKEIPDKHINMIDIDSNNVKVEFIATNDTTPKVTLTGQKSKGSIIEHNVDVEDDQLLIDVDEHQKKLYDFDFGSTGLVLKIYVPDKNYQSIHIVNGNGRVSTGNLQANDIKVTTSNGILNMEDTVSSTLTAKADNGEMDLSHVESTVIDTKTDNGKIKMKDVTGDITGKAKNGMISLITNDLEREIDFATDNGTITIETKEQPGNVTFDVDINNGIVDILDQYKRSTVIGNGDHLIQLKADNGKIVVK